MNRKQKIEFLNSLVAGKANLLELIAQGDSFIVKMGGFYIQNGIRYTEEQFEPVLQLLSKKGGVKGISVGSGEGSQSYILKYTKPYEQKAKD